MATNSLKFYKGKYADFKSLTNKNADSLYFTLPDDTKDPNDVLSSSHGIWLGDKLISSSYVANDRGNLTNVELADKNDKNQTGQFLKYTYKLSDGSTQDVYFNVSELLVQEEFTSGLTYNDNGEVYVKVASAQTQAVTAKTPSNKNFLTVDNNGLAVKSVNTDSTILEKPITVAGVGDKFGGLSGGTVFSAGTSVYDILKELLCNETYPPIGYDYASNTSASMTGLTISVKNGDNAVTDKSIVKYGTALSISGKSGTNSITTKYNKVTGLTNGYRETIDGVKIDKTVVSGNTTALTVSSSDTIEGIKKTYDIKISYSGYKNNAGENAPEETQSASTATGCTITNDKLKLSLGENKITLSGSCPSIKYNAEEVPSVYNISNVGNSSESEKSTLIAAANEVAKNGATGTTTHTVYAVLPFFVNWDTNGNVSGSTATREILPTDKDTIYDFTVIESNQVDAKKYFKIKVPQNASYASMKIYDTLVNKAFVNYTKFDVKEETINIGGVDFKYDVITDTDNPSLSNQYQIIFNKNLHTYK